MDRRWEGLPQGVKLDSAQVKSRRQAAQTAAQAQQAHRHSVQACWLKAVPAALLAMAFLPHATWALLGLLVARSNAGGVVQMSRREMQARISAGSLETVVAGTARLEALGWVAVERRRIGCDLNAVNTYRLVHPLLIEAARQAKGGVFRLTRNLLRRIKRKQVQTYKGRRFATPVCKMKKAERQGRRVKASAGPDGTTGGPSSARRTNDENRRPVCRTAAPCPSTSAPRPF